ncbi:hypothetical protein BAUCODRAFT_22220 [Baudoinia panamericana UAMH 10762]|uniref:PH domain-containing protein n=1 Tax=Baudoinia panamericana (strain UAMH 10762) TaxID=717646 RepID=M2N4J2_BAUPA|nr:uncharacterized protein BAUCODRAFT_22220 [Baudoinia panamericana UAMH 10762]EMC98903.1 hypothetical protein BAUCODRAFT_22220 [Baudoinia panamericana UAMH 10762]
MAENPQDLGMWVEALKAKYEPSPGVKPFGRKEFDNLLGPYGGCTDQPAVLFNEELMAAYPEAKVILRNGNSRFPESIRPVLCHGGPRVHGTYSRETNLIARHYFGVTHTAGPKSFTANAPFFEQWQASARSTYLKHNDHVKQITPPEKLLLFDLDDVWAPLCNFLGKPIPDVAFPKVNETLAIQEKIQLYIAESYKRSFIRFAKRVAPVAALLIAVAICRLRASRCGPAFEGAYVTDYAERLPIHRGTRRIRNCLEVWLLIYAVIRLCE